MHDDGTALHPPTSVNPPPPQSASARSIFGWAMFDFANSSYTTVIVTVYYAVVFPKVIVGDGPDYKLGNLLWSVTLSISYALVVLALPFLGALMDHVGHRKRFLFASVVLTVLATFGLGLVGPGAIALAMGLLIVSNFGFSIGESFVATFLPDLGPPETLGRISGMAWGLGYVGGLLSTAVVLVGLGAPELDNPLVRWSGPITAIWFALAALPTFLWLEDRSRPVPLPVGVSSVWTAGFHALRRTVSEVGRYRDLMVFLVAHFFSMAGLSIVVSFAFIYGDQVIRWSAGMQGAMFVLTQVSATIGALGFGLLQSRWGDKATYALTLFVWVLAVVLIRTTPIVADGLRQGVGLDLTDAEVFLGVGGLAGLCIGATQSAARTLVALLSPPDKVGEFFGLWGMFGKLAAVLGLVSLGVLQTTFGLQDAIMVTGLFFALGLAIVWFVDVDRGRASAGAHH